MSIRSRLIQLLVIWSDPPIDPLTHPTTHTPTYGWGCLYKILGSESFTRWLIGGEVIHLKHTLKACLNELSLTNSAQSKVLKKASCYVMRSVHGPQVFATKSQLTLSVLEPVESHPHAYSQDSTHTEVLTGAWGDITSGIHGPHVSATKDFLQSSPKLRYMGYRSLDMNRNELLGFPSSNTRCAT